MRFLAFLFGIVVGVGGAVAYLVFVSDAAPPPPLPALPEKPALAVTFGESMVTALVQRSSLEAPGVHIPAGAMRAELRDDAIVLHANVELAGQPSRGAVTLRPAVRGGRLELDVVDTSLGALPLPMLERMLDEQVKTRLQGVLALLPVTITGVEVRRATGITVSCQVDLDRLLRPAAP